MLKYRFLMMLVAAVELSRRMWRRDWIGLKARLGIGAASSDQPHLWVHGASNGELASIRPVIARLAKDQPLLVTANTDTGVALVTDWRLPDVSARLAPLDLPGPTRRVFQRWRITAHLTCESDLWPQRVLACPGPVAVIGGRLTERSAQGWARFGPLTQRVLQKLQFLSAQDSGSQDRFVALGLPEDVVGPVIDLKALYAPPAGTPDADLQTAFPRTNTWLAASTHPGEDETILTAHRMALAIDPELRLILAPRHPKRADEIAAMAKYMGLTVARRSHKDAPTTDVYLADTMGEMHLWYALAGRVFVAGSLTDRGGHTPYEPAHFGCALIHGPDVANFQDAYAKLSAACGAREIVDAITLVQALTDLEPEDAQQRMGQSAQSAFSQDSDLDGLMALLHSALQRS